MIKIVGKTIQTSILRRNIVNIYAVSRGFCENKEPTKLEETESHEKKLSGFAKAFEKFSMPQQEVKEKEPDLPFATLFRNSKFVEVN